MILLGFCAKNVPSFSHLEFFTSVVSPRRTCNELTKVKVDEKRKQNDNKINPNIGIYKLEQLSLNQSCHPSKQQPYEWFWPNTDC